MNPVGIVKHLVAAGAIIVLLVDGSVARASDPTQRVTDLAREYRELRAKRRQLPPGVRSRELDDSGGRLEYCLSVLGAELGHPPQTRKGIVEYLGQPDAVLGNREMTKYLGIYERTRRQSAHKREARPDRKYLIYFWRGWHDFLFYISDGGVIVDHGWWFAYE
jgi:hypothetical protein